MSKLLSTEYFTEEETIFNKALLAKLNPSITVLKYFVRLSEVNEFLFPLFEGEPTTVIPPLRRSHLNDAEKLDEYLTQSFFVKYKDYSQRMVSVEKTFESLTQEVQASFRSKNVEVKDEFSNYGMIGFISVESNGQTLYRNTYFMNDMREWDSDPEAKKKEVHHITTKVRTRLEELDPEKKKREERQVRGYINGIIEGYGQRIVFDKTLIQFENDRIGVLPAVFLRAFDSEHRHLKPLLDETLNRHRKMFDMLVMMIKTSTTDPDISDVKLSDEFNIERENRTNNLTVYHVTQNGETEEFLFNKTNTSKE